MDKVLRETGQVIDDGLHEIFVNTVVNDGSDIAELMSCFTKKKVQDPKFPVLSEEVNLLKDTEGGVSAVCEVMRHYEDIARKEGIQQGKLDTLFALVRQGLLAETAAANAAGMSVEEFSCKMLKS